MIKHKVIGANNEFYYSEINSINGFMWTFLNGCYFEVKLVEDVYKIFGEWEATLSDLISENSRKIPKDCITVSEFCNELSTYIADYTMVIDMSDRYVNLTDCKLLVDGSHVVIKVPQNDR